jgi:hypothetical protein
MTAKNEAIQAAARDMLEKAGERMQILDGMHAEGRLGRFETRMLALAESLIEGSGDDAVGNNQMMIAALILHEIAGEVAPRAGEDKQ